MSSKLKFNRFYFVLALLLFGIEVLIAKFAHDQIIRPYFGDLLVVVLLYCFIKSFVDTPYLKTALSVLIFAFALETLQYFHIVNLLGLEHSSLARTVIGTSFEWIDLIAYALGIALVIFTENTLANRREKVKVKIQ